MTTRLGLAALAAPFALLVACGAPDRTTAEPLATASTQPQGQAPATCDVARGAITFDAPRADGSHEHGACDACLQAECCDATVQCFASDGSGPCTALGACLGECPAETRSAQDPKAVFLCRDSCRSAHPSASALYDAYLACRKTSCRAACGDPD